jgi:hypothetical protein
LRSGRPIGRPEPFQLPSPMSGSPKWLQTGFHGAKRVKTKSCPSTLAAWQGKHVLCCPSSTGKVLAYEMPRRVAKTSEVPLQRRTETGNSKVRNPARAGRISISFALGQDGSRLKAGVGDRHCGCDRSHSMKRAVCGSVR